MKRTIMLIPAALCVLSAFGLTKISYADSAEVLPKGRFRVNLSAAQYLPIDTRFDPDGNEEDIATDFNATLNANIFPALALFEESYGGPFPDGSANVGESVVDFEINATEFSFSVQYGLTDNLTVGIEIPYAYYKRKVSTKLDTTNANIGKNPALNTLLPLDAPLPPGVPETVPLTTEDIKNLLGPGLDVGSLHIPGYGYDSFETWSDQGPGDILIGGRYKYLQTNDWRLAFTGGLNLPTGTVDIPESLVDMSFGSGAWGILFQLQNDYIAIEDLVLNASFKYNLVLSDKETLRIPPSVNIPLTRDEEKVDRDIGDKYEIDTSATYTFSSGVSGTLGYQYWHKLKDKIDGNSDLSYESLEDETNSTAHIFQTGLTYSTFHLFKEEKFPLPLEVSLTYENVFAGSNNFLKQESFIFSLSFFF